MQLALRFLEGKHKNLHALMSLFHAFHRGNDDVEWDEVLNRETRSDGGVAFSKTL